MASGATDRDGWRALVTPKMLAMCWLPILAIGALHYGTDPALSWVHNVLRRLYYLPIIVAAFVAGLRGSLSAAVIVSLTYLPHAFAVFGHAAHMDPAGPWEKALEVVLYNAVGAIAGYLATAERRRREELEASLEAQRQLQDQLVRAGQLGALGELVAGVTHEIKTPLHALRGTAEIVDPLIPNDCSERRMWELHKAELDRLGGIAERFQAFARPQTGELAAVDLNDVAKRLRDLVTVEARKHDISIDAALAPSAVIVQADADQLAQVGLNIAVNAIHAIGESGGRIRLRVLPEARKEPEVMHLLEIDNDGPAIPEEELAQLFDPFVGDGGGTGLGLSISERIITLHGGFIEAANRGLGVSFSVFLPSRQIS